MSTVEKYQDKLFRGERKIESIPVNAIRPNPYQPRRSFNEKSIDELAKSIRRYGLIQPIVVRKDSAGTFELIAGERRLRATKKAGFLTINALVYLAGEQDSAVMALIENLQRENLHFFDEAEAYKNLLMEHGLTQEELARKIGKNQSTVANKLRILRLAPSVRMAVLENRLTERHARTLLRLPDEETQLQVVAKIGRDCLSVKCTEELVEKILDKCYRDEHATTRKKMLGVFRDSRLLINGIRKLVDQMSSSGLQAKYDIHDAGDSFEVCVSIPKNIRENMAAIN